MLVTHKIGWNACLSHQIWPAILKGWKDTDKIVHFFWGLGSKNIPEIREVMEKGEEWWYIDVGYFTEQITRYPEPKIHDLNKTFFRIVKGGIHTIRGKVPADNLRLTQLEHLGIDVEHKGWKTGECEHILLCPSSPTVTHHINNMSVEQWVEEVTKEIRKYTDRPIKFRNKPRPNNEFWNTDIKDDLKEAHCLVTNMSLSAIDAVMNMTPAIVHQRNCASFVCTQDISKIEKPMKPGRKTMHGWIKMLAENQFTIPEIESGIAYETLQRQIV